MDLNEFLDKEEKEDNNLMLVEGQLIIAQTFQRKIIELESKKQEIETKEKEFKKQLEEVMRANGITGYESNDKLLKISLGEDTTTESIDKDKLFKEYPEAYRKCLKESKKKGSLRITVREGKNENSNA